ncbi:MAG: methyltransferase regulatory domain-containing protein, partial [Methylocystis sp.]
MTTHFGTAVQAAIARNAASYDDLPYVSHPFPQTNPARLGAIARIFKLKAGDLSRARVLELGCAAGGNLIPLAARHPDAYFLGIDLSQRQIDEGQQRIAALGLSNVNLRRQSLTDLRAKDGGFDYIICHGVYSWVPEPVRDSILRIARENLAPHGVAFISYNVQPGWRLRQTLRDALALHVGSHGSLRERVARAREMLSFLEQNTPAETTWGQIFRAEAASLRTADDSYIGHEFLEDCNEPCSFSEFMAAAGGRGLAYLGESVLSAMMPENMNPAAAPLLRSLAGDNQVSLEQHMDIFTGRTFRQTLLIHKERESACVRRILPEATEGLHFTARPNFEFSREEDGKAFFADGSGAWFSTPDAGVRKAIEALVARLPDSSSIDELVAAIEVHGVSVDDGLRHRIADALLRMALVGLVTASTEPFRMARSLSAKP